MEPPWVRLKDETNAFLCHYEKPWLDNCPREFKLVVYSKHVDDIFVLFKSKNHLLSFCRDICVRDMKI